MSDFVPVELLDRDAALTALAEARGSAARGEGRMVSKEFLMSTGGAEPPRGIAVYSKEVWK